MEDIQRIVDELKEKTATPSIVLEAQCRDAGSTSTTESKFGGTPYLPLGFEYPLSAGRRPLKLLAQLNFSELPALENFPESGILQFYVLPEDAFGVNSDDLTRQDNFRVIYHKDILPKDQQEHNLPEIAVDDDENPFPVGGEFALTATLEDSVMRSEDFRLEDMSPELGDLYAQAADKVNNAISDQDYLMAMIELEKIDTVLFGELGDRGGHRIGGYPAFTQHDPRGNPDKDFDDMDTLLLQIDSQIDAEFDEEGPYIAWGDMGIANFFISADDLRRLDFSRVLYTWDCY